jgi:L-rhamnose mutarotase
MNKKNLLLFVGLISALSSFAFSPYENYLQTENTTHAMLLATAKEGKAEALSIALQGLSEKKTAKQLKKHHIKNLSVFSKKLEGKECFFVYFDYNGKKDYLQAVEDFEATPAVQALKKWVDSVPPAADRGHQWLQLEWINYIHGSWTEEPATNRFAMVTRIKPEDEDHYRSLHQTTWPGITDWMNRFGWQNFSLFFAEVNGTLYEFYYTEQVPSEHPAKNLGDDPCLKRWLKLTDPCQNPLPDAEGTWSSMNPVLK